MGLFNVCEWQVEHADRTCSLSPPYSSLNLCVVPWLCCAVYWSKAEYLHQLHWFIKGTVCQVNRVLPKKCTLYWNNCQFLLKPSCPMIDLFASVSLISGFWNWYQMRSQDLVLRWNLNIIVWPWVFKRPLPLAPSSVGSKTWWACSGWVMPKCEHMKTQKKATKSHNPSISESIDLTSGH